MLQKIVLLIIRIVRHAILDISKPPCYTSCLKEFIPLY